MTWQQLYEKLSELTPEQRQNEVQIWGNSSGFDDVRFKTAAEDYVENPDNNERVILLSDYQDEFTIEDGYPEMGKVIYEAGFPFLEIDYDFDI